MDTLETYKVAFEKFKAKKYDDALEILDEVIKFAPQWKKPLMLKSYILREQGKTAELFLFMQKIIPSFDDKLPEEKNLMATSLNVLGIACQKLALPESASEILRLSAEMSQNNEEACTELSNAILTANSSEKFSADDFKKLYAEYKRCLSDITPYPRKFYNHKRIRIGFLSADFHIHPVIKWAWSLMLKLDKKIFDTYFYSAVEKPDVVTKNLMAVVTNWRDIFKINDAQAAELIRKDEIDILFDLSGHTSNNRLRVAAYHPATVQISGIGYINSTGLDCFEYFLSDVYCAADSEAMREYFTEKIIRLPHSHICYESSTTLKVSRLPCLEKNFVTFGSFNQFIKMTDTMLTAWGKILNAVPDSRLILKNKTLETVDGRDFVGKRLKSCGINIERVDMCGLTGNYLREYDDVDIALDTFPYTGGVTTCEALYMGVPVISLYGDRHGTRFGLSILKNVGLEELAVSSYDDYVKIAITLASKKELLSDLRKNLRGMMEKSPLMDSRIYIREIEEAFIKILYDEQ